MIKNLILFVQFGIILFFGTIHSQQKKDSIIVDYSFWENDFYIGGKEYSQSEVFKILEKDSLTENLIRSANTKNRWGSIIFLAGLYFTGHAIYDIWESNYSYGVSPYQREDEYFIVYPLIAIIFDITGITLITNSKNSFYHAINLYNQNLPSKNQASKYELDLKFDLNKVTLSFKF